MGTTESPFSTADSHNIPRNSEKSKENSLFFDEKSFPFIRPCSLSGKKFINNVGKFEIEILVWYSDSTSLKLEEYNGRYSGTDPEGNRTA